MNTQDYRTELNALINTAARSLSAAQLMSGLINNLASILVISSQQQESELDSLVEIARHELDVVLTKYVQEHRKHARPTA